jgi:hypothetical protein
MRHPREMGAGDWGIFDDAGGAASPVDALQSLVVEGALLVFLLYC